MKFKLKDPGSANYTWDCFSSGSSGSSAFIDSLVRVERSYSYCGTGSVYSYDDAAYAASTLYHSVDSTAKVNRRLKKLDHMMIFVMIAGSYTPVCLIVLHNKIGYILCALVWATAILGIVFKAFWVTCPKWISSVLYIGMGWLCVLAFMPIIHALPKAGFGWLLAGGIIYTIGGVIYALKLPIFNAKHKNFGSHEIFHVFIMLGSACHFIVMYCLWRICRFDDMVR